METGKIVSPIDTDRSYRPWGEPFVRARCYTRRKNDENNLSYGGGGNSSFISWSRYYMKVFPFPNPYFFATDAFLSTSKMFLHIFFKHFQVQFTSFGNPLFLNHNILDFGGLTKYFIGAWCGALVGRSHYWVLRSSVVRRRSLPDGWPPVFLETPHNNTCSNP